MTDIVRILQSYSESKSYIFHYGRKAVLNLIDTGDNWTGELDDIYFLLEYRKGFIKRYGNDVLNELELLAEDKSKRTLSKEHYVEIAEKYKRLCTDLI